jgi:hypothetical protein
MKVRFYQAELFVEPETDFEEEVLSKFHNCTSVLKSGLSLAETKGILIRQECKPPQEKEECANSAPNTQSDAIAALRDLVAVLDNLPGTMLSGGELAVTKTRAKDVLLHAHI